MKPQKPRMHWNGGWWTCWTEGRRGWGNTMELAYRDWVRSHLLRILPKAYRCRCEARGYEHRIYDGLGFWRYATRAECDANPAFRFIDPV